MVHSVALIILLPIIPALCKVTPEDTIDILNCAKKGMLFYPPNKECGLPMVQGMCQEGEMMVLGREGVGECVVNHCIGEIEEDMVWTGEKCIEMYKQPGCNGTGERMAYNLTGGVECVCEEGWDRIDGVCYQHSTHGPCDNTELVLQSENPDHCNCTDHLSCRSFMKDLASLSLFTRHSNKYKAGVARLQANVCSKPLQKVCCSDTQILAGKNLWIVLYTFPTLSHATQIIS